MESAVAVAAVALGTCMVKHFTLARADGGPDGAFPMESEEFKRMDADIRAVEKALGKVSYELTAKEQESIFLPFPVCCAGHQGRGNIHAGKRAQHPGRVWLASSLSAKYSWPQRTYGDSRRGSLIVGQHRVTGLRNSYSKYTWRLR